MCLNAQDYFPSRPNAKYIYKGFKNNFLNFTKYEDYNTDSKIQLRFNNSDSSFLNIYEYTPIGIKLIINKTDIDYRENLINEKFNVNNFIIKEPIKKDSFWFLSDGSKRIITSINANINTIYEHFTSALEITTLSKNNSISIDYYVKNIGLVKSIYYINDIGLLSAELEDIVEDTPLTQNIKFFYPDSRLNSIWFIEKTLNFYTNESNTLAFAKAFELPPKGLLPLINKNVSINQLYFDYNNKFVYIDFSKDLFYFLDNYQKEIYWFIASIFETLRNYYHTDNILITIEKKPYSFNLTSLELLQKKLPTTNQKWIISDCNLPLTYVVKENDSIVNIAEEFETTHLKLTKINKIKNPNLLLPNQVLQIYSSGTYTIKAKDTLNSISEKFGISYEKLLKINNIYDLSLVKPGLKLKVC